MCNNIYIFLNLTYVYFSCLIFMHTMLQLIKLFTILQKVLGLLSSSFVKFSSIWNMFAWFPGTPPRFNIFSLLILKFLHFIHLAHAKHKLFEFFEIRAEILHRLIVLYIFLSYSVLISYCYCNNLWQTQWFKTTQSFYLNSSRGHKSEMSFTVLGRSLKAEHGNPSQYSCLKNPMDRGPWWAPVHGVEKGWTQTEATEACRTHAIIKMLSRIYAL